MPGCRVGASGLEKPQRQSLGSMVPAVGRQPQSPTLPGAGPGWGWGAGVSSSARFLAGFPPLPQEG